MRRRRSQGGRLDAARRSIGAVTLACALACGRVDSHRAATSSAAGGAAGDGAATVQTDAGAPTAGAAPSYSGMVRASVNSYMGDQHNALEASFWRLDPGQVTTTTQTLPNCGAEDALVVGACCEWQVRIGLPFPSDSPPPVAGDVSFELHGQPLGMLKSPDYRALSDTAWQPGDALDVSAAGADVAAFSGTLPTPQAVTGLGPPLQQAPIMIPRDTPLRISWQPDGRPGESMNIGLDVLLNGGSRAVECLVPDADGSVTIDPSLLAPLAGGTDLAVRLNRSLSSSISSSNATIDFESWYWLSLRASFE